MTAFYNEINPFAAEWLRELIKHDIIAPGVVDERSIEDIRPVELVGFTQCHFFAGIGVWSYALRRAGWPDYRPVWTGSCPCQPFSTAGKGKGFTDERHLWPAFFHLISQRRPVTLFGEQVASKDGLAWLDLVQADLEAEDYAFGTTDLCAAGFGAPEIRQRLYFMAEPEGERHKRTGGTWGWRERSSNGGTAFPRLMADAGGAECGRRGEPERGEQRRILYAPDGGKSCTVDNADGERFQGERVLLRSQRGKDTEAPRSGGPCAVADGGGQGLEIIGEQPARKERTAIERSGETDGSCSLGNPASGEQSRVRESGAERGSERENRGPGPANGFWGNALWLPCKDGKARPVKPGSFPLVNGTSARVGRVCDSGLSFDADNTPEARVMRLRGYGNAIVAPVAEAWIRTYMEETAREVKPEYDGA
jgi:DNA (cytosine-5)-methyltransferase 1